MGYFVFSTQKYMCRAARRHLIFSECSYIVYFNFIFYIFDAITTELLAQYLSNVLCLLWYCIMEVSEIRDYTPIFQMAEQKL